MILSTWRQGDLALEERWFVHVADPSCALTPASEAADGNTPQAIDSEVLGLAVVSQTCDIVRTCLERHFIEVAPLVKLLDRDVPLAKKGFRPQYFVLPEDSSANLAIDLDRVMTVEKSIVASWNRTASGLDVQGTRALAGALARKRGRTAFPDDFNKLIAKFRDRLVNRHGKRTDEGEALRLLREIRITAEPSWDVERIHLHFWFLCDDDAANANQGPWDRWLKTWLELISESAKYSPIDGVVVSMSDLTARDYVLSDPLDLDQITIAEGHSQSQQSDGAS